jgi:hypothetical protein
MIKVLRTTTKRIGSSKLISIGLAVELYAIVVWITHPTMFQTAAFPNDTTALLLLPAMTIIMAELAICGTLIVLLLLSKLLDAIANAYWHVALMRRKSAH